MGCTAAVTVLQQVARPVGLSIFNNTLDVNFPPHLAGANFGAAA